MYLGTTTRTVDRLVGKARTPMTPVRFPGLRRVLFDRAEGLDAFVDAGKATTTNGTQVAALSPSAEAPRGTASSRSRTRLNVACI